MRRGMLSRVQKIHAKFLESSRSVSDGRGYWDNVGPLRRWFAQLITPVPLLALDDEGRPLYDALQWLESKRLEHPLNEDLVRHYHRLLKPKSPEPPGEYRRGAISMKDSAHVCPPPAKVPPLMKRFGEELEATRTRLDAAPDPDEILKSAALLHHRLVSIHPFADANGRVARLLMNHVLRRYDQPYVILPPMSACPEHVDALRAADAGDIDPLTELAKRFRVRTAGS